MNPALADLQPYPFERLRALKSDTVPNSKLGPIDLSIGEPKHPAPDLVLKMLSDSLGGISKYPLTRGSDELRQSIADWIQRRYTLPPDIISPTRNVLPVNGTREALFSIAHCIVTPCANALVLSPNPFYQIYEGAALLSGARPWYLNLESDGSMPDFESVSPDIWDRCQLIYICSPGNPSGAVIPARQLETLIQLANRHDFVIASDECYSEIYPTDAPPPVGLLQVAADMGQQEFRHCLAFHSLSKRSNLPGLRSGFVAGDPELIKRYLLYRTYHGCAMPVPTQAASIAAWCDETHVEENRRLYDRKFLAVLDILTPYISADRPDAAFYLWAETPIDDEEFARSLYLEKNVTVLPGSYLSRESSGVNPGKNRIRMALVAPESECIEAANRIREFIEALR